MYAFPRITKGGLLQRMGIRGNRPLSFKRRGKEAYAANLARLIPNKSTEARAHSQCRAHCRDPRCVDLHTLCIFQVRRAPPRMARNTPPPSDGCRCEHVGGSGRSIYFCTTDKNCLCALSKLACTVECPCGGTCVGDIPRASARIGLVSRFCELVSDDERGRGLVTKTFVPSGVVIGSYTGRVCSSAFMAAHDDATERAARGGCLPRKFAYTMRCEGGFIDAFEIAMGPYPTVAHANHSCAPTCAFMKTGVGAVHLVTLVPISMGGAVTVDYGRSNPCETCLCGEPSCKGFF